VHWADEATKEPSEDDLRIQAYRVAKVFAQALHEGSQKAFYFILGHYVERNLQYGLIHQDLTPRPAYVAFAAVGRLLNGATPLGQVDLGDKLLKGYVFRAVVDGDERDTMVAWSETKPAFLDFEDVEEAYDYLGREVQERSRVKLTRAPIFLVGRPGAFEKLPIDPQPANPPWRDGSACPVVLQLVGRGDFKRSAFNVGESREIRLSVYNFGEQHANGIVAIEGGGCDAPEITIEPGAKVDRTIRIGDAPMMKVELHLEGLGRAIAAARINSNSPQAEPPR
jgi:hypothetical protein